jgi:hypothetical protein
MGVLHLEGSLTIPFERLPHGPLTGGREQVDGESPDVETGTRGGKVRDLVPSDGLQVEKTLLPHQT